jgi:hypothetical protein
VGGRRSGRPNQLWAKPLQTSCRRQTVMPWDSILAQHYSLFFHFLLISFFNINSRNNSFVGNIMLLLFLHHCASCIPIALHHIALGSYMLKYARLRSRRAKIRNSSGASPRRVWWSTSAKCEDTNIAFGSRQALVHLTTILELCFSLCFNYDSWMCIRSYELD